MRMRAGPSDRTTRSAIASCGSAAIATSLMPTCRAAAARVSAGQAAPAPKMRRQMNEELLRQLGREHAEDEIERLAVAETRRPVGEHDPRSLIVAAIEEELGPLGQERGELPAGQALQAGRPFDPTQP